MQNGHAVWVLATLAAGCGATVDGLRADPVDAAPHDVSAEAQTLDVPDGLPHDVASEGGVTDRPPRSDLSAQTDARIVAPPAVPHVIDLAANGSGGYQCAVMSDGTVRCRGTFFTNQITYDDQGRVRPGDVVVMEGLDDVAQVVGHHELTVCARRHDGTVWCWGYHRYNRLGVGSDGAELCDGEPCRRRPTRVEGLDDVVSLARGAGSTCAVRGDGSVWCWGNGDPFLDMRASVTPRRIEGLPNVVSMWRRFHGWVLLLRDGSYVWAGRVQYAAIPRDATFARGDDAGHLCYRLPDATIRCLGFSENGAIGNGVLERVDQARADDPGLTGVRSVVTGPTSTCAVRDDDTVWCWGGASNGALGYEGPERCVTAVSPPCSARPRQVPGLDGVERVFVTPQGGCALRRDRSLWCWGSVGDPRYSPVPAPIVW